MSSNVTYDQYYQWIKEAEEEALNNPDSYKQKVGLFAMMGYAFVFGLIILTLAALIGLGALVAMKQGGGGYAVIIKLGIALVIFAWMLIAALWVKFDPPEGRRIKKEQFPEFFAELEILQKKLNTIPIHEVILTHDLNAFVVQTPKLGPLGWHTNTLAIGLELLLVMSREEAKAVIAHELGHLSGNHSKFAGWIYRVRKTWNNLISKFEERASWGGIIIEKFFYWYVPRFDAYSFALGRQNEYEADAASVELTSKEDAARALVKVNVFAPYLEEIYWDELFAQTKERAEPEKMAYIGFVETLEKLDIPKDRLEKIYEARMQRETGYEDTHPALKDRLAAIGMSNYKLDFDALDFKNSAAKAFFGDKFEKVISLYDKEWWEGAQASWTHNYEQVQAEKETLTQLKNTPCEELSEDDFWNLALFSARYESDEQALELFRAFRDKYTDDPDATHAIARLLRKMDNDACLEEWAKIPSSSQLFVQAYDEAAHYLDQKGRHDEAAEWRNKADARYGDIQEAHAERDSVTDQDVLTAPKISNDNKDYILERLEKHRFVKHAWLAEKEVKHADGMMPVYVIAFKAKALYKPSAQEFKKHFQSQEAQLEMLLDEFGEAHMKDNPMRIYLTQYSPPLAGKMAKKVKQNGTQIF